MKLYILTDENDTIRGVTTSLREKEKIEEEYTRLWELEQVEHALEKSDNLEKMREAVSLEMHRGPRW